MSCGKARWNKMWRLGGLDVLLWVAVPSDLYDFCAIWFDSVLQIVMSIYNSTIEEGLHPPYFPENKDN